MKKTKAIVFSVLIMIFGISSGSLLAQDGGKMTFQFGTGFKMTGDPFIYEISPIVGVGYCFDNSNSLGLGVQADLGLYKQDPSPDRHCGMALLCLYAYYLRDFGANKPVNFYNECRLGVADLISPGLMIGFEPGVRIKLSDWGALRIGLTAQASRLMYVNMANDNYYAVEYAVGLNVKLDL